MLEEDKPKYDVGVSIGRFQVPILHSEHMELLDTINNSHKIMIVVLGITDTLSTIHDPYDFAIREIMIREMYPNAIILPLADVPSSDIEWSKNLDNLIASVIGGNKSVCLYGSKDSFIPSYHGKYKCIPLLQRNYISGSDIRESLKNYIPSTIAERKAIVWALYNRWPSTIGVVDIAIENDDNQFAMISKSIEEPYIWQFPGGFAEALSKSYEQDAIREAYEEVNLTVDSLQYICSAFVDNYRYRKTNDKLKTVFFYARRQFGKLTANDDARHAKWFTLKELIENMGSIDKNHLQLLESLIKFKENK